MNKYAIIIFVLLLSCKEKKKMKSNNFNLKNSDEIYKRVSKIPENQLTKIEIPEFIDLDTIEGESRKIDITIKNRGQRNLTSLVVKPPCSCNELSKYDSIMLPNQEQTISVNMKFEKLGNFYQGISIYGSFYPYIKKVYIEGYRRK